MECFMSYHIIQVFVVDECETETYVLIRSTQPNINYLQ